MPPPSFRLSTAVLLVALASTAEAPYALAKDKKSHAPKTQPAAQEPIAGSVLTRSEQELNCKRMAGRMQVRILELRGAGISKTGSGLAQGLQSAVQPIFGGTRRGADIAADTAHDIAKLREMNALLKTRGCPHYDLDAELARDAKAPSPRLVKGNSSKGGKGGGTDLKAKAKALAKKANAWSTTATLKSTPAKP